MSGVSLTLPVQHRNQKCLDSCKWVGFLWHCLQQLLWKHASHANKSKLRILRKKFSSLLFSAVSSTTSLHIQTRGGFGCPNTFLFCLLLIFFITEDTVRFQNHCLKSCGRTPRSCRLLNCFWILRGRFQAIKIFGKAPITVSMIAMLCIQFLRHLVAWI